MEKILNNFLLSVAIKKVYFYLPFFVLVLGVVVRFWLATTYPGYIFDEVIVTTISRQPWAQMFDTLISEPHPPGFYMFLRWLPTENSVITHQILTLLQGSIVSLVLVWGYWTKTIQKNELQPGIAIFLASFAYFEIAFYSKQDIFSVPLYLAFILGSFSLFQQSSRTMLRTLIILHTLALLTFTLSYIYYFFTLALLVLITVMLNSKIKTWYLFIAHAVIISTYTFWLGWDQLITNQGRFSWFGLNYNSSLSNLSRFLTGDELPNTITDISVLVFIGLLVLLVVKRRKIDPKRQLLMLSMLMGSSIVMLGYYFLELFVRSRYTTPLMLVLCILAGWGATLLPRFKILVIGLVVTVLTISGLRFSYLQQSPSFLELTKTAIDAEITDGQYALISEAEVYAFVFKALYPNLTTVYPKSMFNEDLDSSGVILKEHLQLDGVYTPLTDTEIKQHLIAMNTTHYMYIMIIRQKPSYFDPNRDVLRVLNHNCQKTRVRQINFVSTLHTFSECDFSL